MHTVKYKYLTQTQVDQFHELGSLSPLRFLSASACQTISKKIDTFWAARPADAVWAFDIKTNLLFDWVYELGAHSRILDAAEDLLGPNILNTNTVFRIKEPGSTTRYGWHQDAARIDVHPCFIIAFVAITESSLDNGGLRVIPGSHRSIQPFELVVNDDGQAKRRVARTLHVREDGAVDLTLAAGEATLFSGRLVHGSCHNVSTRRRIAILTDYTAAHARQSRGRGSGQLVRGRDQWGHFAHEPVPVGSCTALSVKQRREILNRYPENPLMGPLAPGEPIQFPDQPSV